MTDNKGTVIVVILIIFLIWAYDTNRLSLIWGIITGHPKVEYTATGLGGDAATPQQAGAEISQGAVGGMSGYKTPEVPALPSLHTFTPSINPSINAIPDWLKKLTLGIPIPTANSIPVGGGWSMGE